MNEIQNGWVFEAGYGALCHFEHFPLSKAEQMENETKAVFVVETINWTHGENEKTVHHNKYFAMGLSEAIALAVRIEVASQEVAENVVSIRRSTADEEQIWRKVDGYFDRMMPAAINDLQAEQL